MKSFSDIMSEYEHNRLRAEASFERAEAAAREASSELAALEARLSLLLDGAVKQAMLSGAPVPGEARAEAYELGRSISALKKELGVEAPAYTCPECRDTGYVEREGSRQMCGCLIKKLYNGALGALPIGVCDFREDIFRDEAQKKDADTLWRIMQARAARFPEIKKSVMLLMGEAGLGKTFLMRYLASLLQKKTPKVLFMGAYSLFEAYHAARLGDEARPLWLVEDADVLLIDDLGTEPLTQNVTREQLFRLLEARRDKLTVISTNLDEYSLKERYYEKVYSRIALPERAEKLVLHGTDLRGCV